MNSEPVEVREPLAADITDADIAALIAEREEEGAQNCHVETEAGQRYLVCMFPPV